MAKIQDLRGQTMGGQDKRAKITKISRHHSGTVSGNVFVFEKSWKAKGWRTGGYHEVILSDGTVQLCYEPDVVTNGVYGHNQTTYHICVVGNGEFTEEQEKSFKERALYNLERFKLSANDVLGHNEFSGTNTACPGTDMEKIRAGLKSKPKPKYIRLIRLTSPFMRGEDIKVVQRKLGVKDDGIYGPISEKAVRNYQQKHRLLVDGIVGPQTWNHMF